MFRQILAASCVAILPFAANASAIITDGNVKLGVDDFGQLNPTDMSTVADIAGETIAGVRWIDSSGAAPVEYESTSHGCYCEGWGVDADGDAGYTNNDDVDAGLAGVSFASTASTATSTVEVIAGTRAGLTVTHDFAISSSSDLFEVKVTIDNSGVGATDIASLGYRRVMDWDTSPTPFDEYVSILGTATTTDLAHSSNDGFASSKVFSSAGYIGGGCGVPAATDFTACGPRDHGAVFDFTFGALAAGETKEFSIFYGGALGKTAAMAALASVGAELASFGWSHLDADQDGCQDRGTDGYVDGVCTPTPTFIFAFKGVGGKPIDPIPLPAGAWLLLGGLGAFAGLKRRKKA